MFQTVTAQPLRQDRSSEKEKVQLANDSRDALNMTSKVRVESRTLGTGVLTEVFRTDDVPEGAALSIEVWVIGRGPGVRALFGGTALYYREPGGATTIQGAFGTPSIDSSGGAMGATFVGVGNAISIQVRDNGATITDWVSIIEVFVVK